MTLGLEGKSTLENFSHAELVELVQVYAKNLIAMDGVWFQSLEREEGMDAALHHDAEAWKRFTVSEARRIKDFLKLPFHSGLEGLEKALLLKATTLSNRCEVLYQDNVLVFRILECRVQVARQQKGIPFHPCKSVGLVEYDGFARTIDERITSTCLSCFPDRYDDSCSCSWQFVIDE